ncbi:hypothetical protein [Prosthecobacter sp.]|jgi:hypothetical protein|uniref:hypothetical protein n=1 Tax=Prosthecobacter sp. TaxID=1965333 RepID=UPI003783F5F2
MKKSEKMLLGVFAALFIGIVLVGGGLFAFRNFLEVRDEVALLRDRLASMNLAISQGAEWAERNAWLDETVPGFTSNKDASAKLLEVVSQEAQKHSLTIGTTEFLEPARVIGADGLPVDDEEGHFDKAAIKTILTGVPEKALFSWLHELQKPGSFLGVTRLQINPSGSNKTVNVEVEFTQFYREKAAPKVTKAN